MNRLNILYSTDNNYAPHAAASMYSLLEHNADFDEIHIFLIDDAISDENREKLNLVCGHFSNARLYFYPYSKVSDRLKIKKTWFSNVGYARLMMSSVVDVDRILYLDCDTIVSGSLRELWEQDMSDCIVAGVQDNPALYALTTVGLDASDRYINSGVMLIDLKKWREEQVEDQILQMIEEHNGFVQHHDQGIINGVCRKKIKIIHPKFNVMSQFFQLNAEQIQSLYDVQNYYTQKELDEATEQPVIVHYISKFYNRPWFKDCSHPLKQLYLDNLNKTPFEVELSDKKQKRSVRIRRFIFQHTPFCVYATIERILDVRRRRKVGQTD